MKTLHHALLKGILMLALLLTACQPTAPLPAPTQAELIAAWQPAYNGVAVAMVVCDVITDVALENQAGEMTWDRTFDHIVVGSLWLTTTHADIQAWEPQAAVAPYKAKVTTHLESVENIMTRWLKEEITSADVPDLLAETCTGAHTLLLEIVDAAKEAGMTQDSFAKMDTAMEEYTHQLPSVLE